jgi:hypothetical protein
MLASPLLRTIWATGRWGDWVASKGGALFGMLFWTVLCLRPHSPDALQVCFLAVVSAAGFGLWGHVLNDWGDIHADAIAGKPNRVAGLPGYVRWLLLALALLLMILPWLGLPFTAQAAALLALELLLFVAYSIPPLRLKERLFWAPIADSLYAVVVPAGLAFVTLAFYSTEVASWWDAHLMFWLAALFLRGLRGILLHQWKDAENDRLAGCRTYGNLLPTGVLLKQVYLLALVELGFLMAALIWTEGLALGVGLLALGSALFSAVDMPRREDAANEEPQPSPLNGLLDSFYQSWLPLWVLVFLAPEQPLWAVFLGVYLLVPGFQPAWLGAAFRFMLRALRRVGKELRYFAFSYLPSLAQWFYTAVVLEAYFFLRYRLWGLVWHRGLLCLFWRIRWVFSRVVNYGIYYVRMWVGRKPK